jgi:hypothetical protein
MKNIALGILAAITLGGCGEFMDGYNEARAHRGEPGYSSADYAAKIGDQLKSGVGRFANGYAQGAADYQYTHPTVYVQPSYVAPALPQHGTATVTPTGFGSFGAPSYNINY